MAADWYKKLPSNRNFLTPVGFKLILQRFGGVDFFCQSASIPEVAMPTIEIATPFRGVPIIPGGGVEYGDLSVRFIVDEDLANYMAVWNWIRDNGNAESFDGEGEGYSDGILQVLTSNFNTKFNVKFERLMPVSLTSIPFDFSVGEIDFFTANVTFKYTRYTVYDLSMQPL